MNALFQDTYLTANHKSPEETPDYTFTQANPYVDHGYFDSLPNEVEDYIFICENSSLKVMNSTQVFKAPLAPSAVNAGASNAGASNASSSNASVKSTPLRLSDHYGVLTTFAPPHSQPEMSAGLRLANLKISP